MSEKSIDDGGPAFPCFGAARMGMDYDVIGGMSLRDWFAAMALQGLLAGNGDYDLGAMEDEAYERADLMIERRKMHTAKGAPCDPKQS